MFLEFATQLVSLNIEWIMGFIFGNLQWVFMIATLAYFMNGGKNLIPAFVFILAEIWVLMDFEVISQAILYFGTVLAAYYISKLALVGFVESTPSLQNKLLPIFLLQGWIVIVAFNVL